MEKYAPTLNIFDNKTQEVLLKLEKTQKEFWNIDRITANFLYIQILATNAKRGIEIGTSNGYSGIWLGSAFKKTGGTLTTIEFWDKRQSVAIENFKVAEIENNIIPKLGSAFNILQEIASDVKSEEEKFDFAFIDANKKEYIEYFKLLDPILTKGALICADNILSHEEKVQPFVQEITNNPNYQTQVLNIGTGILLSYKKN